MDSTQLVNTVSSVLAMPGVKVNRREFLSKTLKVDNDKIALLLDKGPIGSGLFTREEIAKIAKNLGNKRNWQTSSLSFASGIPGGVAMAATIPTDILQFFSFTLKIAQEIAYLYDSKDFWIDKNTIDEKVKSELMLYLGTMFGVGGAASSLRYISQVMTERLVTELPKQALTKTIWYPILKNIGQYVGIKVTKDSAVKGISKVVPILGGIVSGGITYFTINKMNNRLITELDKRINYTDIQRQSDIESMKKEMPEVYDAVYEEILDHQ
ncbi:bacteriochlorophyll 4-vinyl reductase [Otariodibacter oris]|uniref:EcsC family protein n=1 Tax=Otariodibacter oris TaxID=1032623 RepID=A0A420XHN0_9PAST|nr:bacteriochlorophyll 4-vinyl reductase [Otariodibacter oris]QGM81055.1 hypothetical protein A6A10_06375 [Otariodibacter oris]RKR76759.1 hypothetical protein DES31_0065 [Otariodibacter oris]